MFIAKFAFIIMSNYIYNIILFVIATFTTSSIHANTFTVVIDPGHGGKDYGALGIKAKEKDINLSVALLLGNMIDNKLDNINVVYTRSNDKFLSLRERADIANKASGDIFISIHTNSIAKKAKNRKTISGASVYTLGLHKTNENFDVAKRENSVIELEEDYSTSYSGFDPNSSESYIIFELNQNKHLEQSIEFASAVQDEFIHSAGRKDRGVRQAGFLVLAATSMPSILVELDFICNPTQEKFLSSKSGQKKLATAIFNALKKYINKYNRSIKINETITNTNTNTNTNKQDIPTKETHTNKIEYRIQFLTSNKIIPKNDKRLKGLAPVEYYKDKNIYKYTYGSTSSWDEAVKIQNKIKNKFPEAFIVKFKNNKRI